MQQLELDSILNGSENALTDRQTAADARRENMQRRAEHVRIDYYLD